MHVSRAIGAVAGALLLLLATAAITSARAPEVITIDIDLDTLQETFSTPSGSLLCATGPVVSTYDHFGGNANPATTFHLTKLLDCGDGDTLTIRVDAVANSLRSGTTGGWSIVEGTGAFAGFNGGGHIVGTPGDGDPIDLIDHYYGNIQP